MSLLWQYISKVASDCPIGLECLFRVRSRFEKVMVLCNCQCR